MQVMLIKYSVSLNFQLSFYKVNMIKINIEVAKIYEEKIVIAADNLKE